MQTSKAKTHLARFGKVLAFLCVIIALNMGLIFALQPYGMTHDVIWYNYRKLPNNTLDTLVVGSSYSSFGIDPTTLDETMGSSSYNLSTMAQTFCNSMDAIDTVQKSHDLKRVIICIGPSSMQWPSEYDREVLFFQSKSVGEPLPDVLHNLGTLVFDEENFPTSKSLMWMFPWICDTVELNPQAIVTNIRQRLEYSDPTDLLVTHDSRWRYMGRGHCAYDFAASFDTLDKQTISRTSTDPFREKSVREYCQLLDRCEQLGYKTYVVIAPRPDYENLRNQDDAYPQLMASLQKITEEHGATYLDYNMTKPSVYRPKNTDFEDIFHLNVEGSKRFSKAMGNIISKIEKNQEVDDLFYSYDNWSEYLNSFDKVALCYYSYATENENTEITAYSVARPNTNVEYRFEIAPKGTHDFSLLQDFSANETCTIPSKDFSESIICIAARVVGSNDANDCRLCFVDVDS